MQNYDLSPQAKELLEKDLIRLKRNLPGMGTICAPKNEKLTAWRAVIKGNTLFEGATFYIDIDIPANYPLSKPICRFNPVPFHPNIGSDGTICIDILNDWSPGKYTLTGRKQISSSYIESQFIIFVIKGIWYIFVNPNPQSPANGIAGDLFQKADKSEFRNKIQDYIREYH